MEGYTGEGEPPCIVMTLTATNETVSVDANFTVTLNGVQPPNTITITRSPDAANFQAGASTDDNDRFTRPHDSIGKLHMVYVPVRKLKLCIYFIQSVKLKKTQIRNLDNVIIPNNLFPTLECTLDHITN